MLEALGLGRSRRIVLRVADREALTSTPQFHAREGTSIAGPFGRLVAIRAVVVPAPPAYRSDPAVAVLDHGRGVHSVPGETMPPNEMDRARRCDEDGGRRAEQREDRRHGGGEPERAKRHTRSIG